MPLAPGRECLTYDEVTRKQCLWMPKKLRPYAFVPKKKKKKNLKREGFKFVFFVIIYLSSLIYLVLLCICLHGTWVRLARRRPLLQVGFFVKCPHALIILTIVIIGLPLRTDNSNNINRKYINKTRYRGLPGLRPAPSSAEASRARPSPRSASAEHAEHVG